MSAVTNRQSFTGCKEGYVGDVKHNLRDGFGVYTYPNNFFRYEGEWNKGLKDGFGKFNMRDGSYYEGQFVHGEIDGTGRRFWAYNGNHYEGQFEKGEMNGQGVMKFGDGRVYEGTWMDNRMEGSGIMTYLNGGVHDGTFHNHKRHGEGRYESEDEVYHGEWINNMKHGSGMINYQDGTVYQGQWRADAMNGEGTLAHASGIKYEGIWCNGRPLFEPSKMRVEGCEEKIILEQNNAVFSLQLQCITDDDEVTSESGRTLKLTAGIRYQEKEPTAEIAEETPPPPETKTTPFGFDVEVYPVTVKKITTEEETITSQSRNASPINSLLGVVATTDNPPIQGIEKKPSPTVELINERIDSGASPVPDNESTTELPSVPPQQTVNGRTCFVDVTLPFVKQVRAASVLRIPSPDNSDVKRNKNRRMTEVSNTRLGDSRLRTEEREGNSKKRKSRVNKQEEKDEEVQVENYCIPGDYVIIVEDVTENPFLGIRLDPLFVHVNVLPSEKKIKSSRSNEKY